MKRKKTPAQMDLNAMAIVSPGPDLSKAARWLLSLTGGDASAAYIPQSSNSELGAQPPVAPSELLIAAAPTPLEDKARSVPDLPIELAANREGAAKVAAGSAMPGTSDIAPFAELSLTPTAVTTAANLMTPAKSDSSATGSRAAAPAGPRASAEVAPQPESAIANPGSPAALSADLSQGNESSPNSSAKGQNGTSEAPKKKEEIFAKQSENSSFSSDLKANDQSGVSATTATGAPESSPKINDSVEPPSATSRTLEPAGTEATKPAGSSVGTIELQIKSADDSSVGLRFVQRQGHVEIQMKSGDAQMVKDLSENLGALKTSLNETGWDVESRLQTRVTPVEQASQTAAFADKVLSPLAQFQASNLAARFDSLPTAAGQHQREVTDQSAASQLPQTEQVSNAQMNRQGGSESSPNHDQSRPNRDDSSGRNGQQERNNNASPDSERQGRRPNRPSDAWLESMESNMTRSSSSGFKTGDRK